ncbi:MAG: hypothetical protein AseanaTS_00860 [Candidatus Pelagadaptatus aseana]
MELASVLPIYALCVATLLTFGETLVVIRTRKYWPLSLDDYLACALLAYCALTFEQPASQLLMLIAWAFMSGNLYAMLFTRMDPNGGSRERLPALSIMLLLSLIGILINAIVILN